MVEEQESFGQIGESKSGRLLVKKWGDFFWVWIWVLDPGFAIFFWIVKFSAMVGFKKKKKIVFLWGRGYEVLDDDVSATKGTRVEHESGAYGVRWFR